jgi:hypothetical protein
VGRGGREDVRLPGRPDHGHRLVRGARPPGGPRAGNGERRGRFGGGREVWSDEYRFRRADGGYSDVADRAHVVRDAETGEPVRVLGSMMDVSERRRAEEALRESEERSASSSRTRSTSSWSPTPRHHKLYKPGGRMGPGLPARGDGRHQHRRLRPPGRPGRGVRRARRRSGETRRASGGGGDPRPAQERLLALARGHRQQPVGGSGDQRVGLQPPRRHRTQAQPNGSWSGGRRSWRAQTPSSSGSPTPSRTTCAAR